MSQTHPIDERRTCVDCGADFYAPTNSPFDRCPDCHLKDND